MKKHKILLDIAMSITMILLIIIYITKKNLHEVLGIIFIIEFIIHKIFNYKSIKMLFKQFLKKSFNKPLEIMFVVDLLLTIAILLSCISGILITNYLFSFNIDYKFSWYVIHTFSSYLSVVFVLIHLYIHKKYIIGIFNSSLKIKNSKIQSYLFNVIILVGLGLLILSFNKSEIIKKIDNANKSKKNEEIKIPKKSTATTPTQEQINSHLQPLRCDGCSRRCSLLTPLCIIGEQKAATETVRYVENYTGE